MSLGMEGKGQYFQIMDGYIQKIINKGTIMVAATGNNGADGDGSANVMNYPAGCANVIGVGSIGRNGTISDFSTKNSSVDVVAPGEEAVSLKYSDPTGYYIHTYVSGGRTYGLDGTSFACPIVAAAAAIAKQRDRNIDTGAFLTALKRTSRDAGAKGYDKSYGYGILDIGKLTTYLKTAALTASFNANGGKVGTASKTVWPGGKYGHLPTPTKRGAVFSGWYTSRSGGQRITSSGLVGSSGVTLYAHWQPGNTLKGLAASKGTLSPVFSYKKTSYKLTLSKKVGQTKIAPAKPSGAKMKIKVGSGKYKSKSSVTVKLKKGAKTKVYVKVSKKGMKTKLYKISVQRKK
jgi:uncharacterized repeat protein (TIGR02543 family)